jgi:hypothetical protein
VNASGSAERHYPRLLPRVAVTVALVVMLTLTSTVGFAAWNATVGKPATVTAGTVGISSSGFAGLAHTYTATSTTRIAPVAVSNTGTVPLTLSSAAIGATGALAPGVTLALWKAPTTGCQAAVPSTGVFTTTLNVATAAIPASLAFAVPTTGLALCAATTLSGTVAALAGQSVSATITLTASVGTQWTATDASTARSLTQSVQGVLAPTTLTCATGPGYTLFIRRYDGVTLQWKASAGADGYRIYAAKPGGARQLVGSTTETRFDIDGSDLNQTGQITVTIVAMSGGTESAASSGVPVLSTSGWLSRDINCG